MEIIAIILFIISILILVYSYNISKKTHTYNNEIDQKNKQILITLKTNKTMNTQTTNTTTVITPSYEALKGYILNNNEKDAIACMKAMYDDFDFNRIADIDRHSPVYIQTEDGGKIENRLHIVFAALKRGMSDLVDLIIG